MARKDIVRITCDRCERSTSEDKVVRADETLLKTKLNVDTGGVLGFNDLCPKCASRVNTLVGEICQVHRKEAAEDVPPEDNDGSE